MSDFILARVSQTLAAEQSLETLVRRLAIPLAACNQPAQTEAERAGEHAAAAADQAFSEKAALSLALNPNEAQYLALSMKQGEVAVIVRGLGDVELHPMEIASFKRLIK